MATDSTAASISTFVDPRARLLMLEQWRAGRPVSEALALEVADLSLDTELPTIRVQFNVTATHLPI